MSLNAFTGIFPGYLFYSYEPDLDLGGKIAYHGTKTICADLQQPLTTLYSMPSVRILLSSNYSALPKYLPLITQHNYDQSLE